MLNTFRTELQEFWKEKELQEPTPVQEQLFKEASQGNDVIALSPTGTGKTLAYLLPILNQIEANKTLQAIILAPSQELVMQIGEVAREWGKVVGIKTQTLIGGANIKRQIDKLKDKPELIIATPGRFIELTSKTKKIKVHLVKTIVFDEADYLFKDEHKRTIESIQQTLMRDVQKVYASATMTEEFVNDRKAENNDIKVIRIDSQESVSHIQHYFITVNNRYKVDELKRLAQMDNMRAIVFFEQINQIEEVAAKLIYENVSVVVLHSDASKQEREYAIRAFKNHDVTYLLTTDVASRGMDISEVPYVIHYNRVQDSRTYIHRSGRTGRMNREGIVISLLNQQEANDLAAILKEENIPLTEKVLKNRILIDPTETKGSKNQDKQAQNRRKRV